MLQIPTISLDLALIAGRAVFLVFCFVIAAVAFARWRRASEHTVAAFAEQNAVLLARLSLLEESAATTHRQLEEMAERLDGNAGRLAPSGAAAPSYQIAIRLARGGAPREELMKTCGLTRQEADLVQRLHAPARVSKVALAS